MNKPYINDINDPMPSYYNRDPSIKEQTIPTYMDEYCAKYSSNICASYFDYHLQKRLEVSFASFLSLTLRLSAALLSLEIPERKTFTISATNNFLNVVSMYAGMTINNVEIGMYPTYSSDSIKYIVNNSDVYYAFIEDLKLVEKYMEVIDQMPSLKIIITFEDIPESIKLKYNMVKFYNIHNLINLIDKENYSNLSIAIAHNYELAYRQMNIKPSTIGSILYTSGTTGYPKGCMMMHDSIIFSGIDACKCMAKNYMLLNNFSWEQTKEECSKMTTISFLPMNHILSKNVDTNCFLYLGYRVYFGGKNAIQDLLVLLKTARPNFLYAVPRLYEKIMERFYDSLAKMNFVRRSLVKNALYYGNSTTYKTLGLKPNYEDTFILTSIYEKILNKIKVEIGLDKCQGLSSAGAKVSREVVDFFISLKVPIANMYGMSEVGATFMQQYPNFNLDAVGKPIGNSKNLIKGEPNQDYGEICILSRGAMSGYYKREEENELTFDEKGYIHSGDLGKIDSNGFIYVTGRKKELLITSGGENISPNLIEDNVKKYGVGYIRDVMAVGDGRKYITALITLERQDTDLKQLGNHWIEFSKGKSIDLNSMQNLSNNTVVRGKVKEIIDIANNYAINNVYKIRDFIIIDEPFSLETGELTNTLKMKRKIITKKYENIIESMYE